MKWLASDWGDDEPFLRGGCRGGGGVGKGVLDTNQKVWTRRNIVELCTAVG